MKESSAFRSVQSSSKSNPSNLFHSSNNYSINYSRIADLYLNDVLSQDSSNFISTRQQNYILPKSTTRNLNSGIDKLSTDTVLSYNYNIGANSTNMLNPTAGSIIGDSVSVSNIFKKDSTALGKSFNGKVLPLDTNLIADNHLTNSSVDKLLSVGISPRGGLYDDGLLRNPTFKLRSSDQQLLSFEKNIRSIENLSASKVNTNFSDTSLSVFGNTSTQLQNILNKASTTFTPSHIPTTFLGYKGPNIAYDRFLSSGSTPDMLMDDKNPLILPFFYKTP